MSSLSTVVLLILHLFSTDCRNLQAPRPQRCSHRSRVCRPDVAKTGGVRFKGYFVQGRKI